jgi:hypothetical protein
MSASFLRAPDRPAQQRGYLRLAGSVAGAVRDGRGRDVVSQRQLGDLLHVGLPAGLEPRSPARTGGSALCRRSLRPGLCVVLATFRFLWVWAASRFPARGRPGRIEAAAGSREPGAGRTPDARPEPDARRERSRRCR